MDTRFLESFLTVAEAGSVAEAARRLGLTPTAVAQRLQALEAELGAPLVARAGRHVLPTEAGRAILPRARQLLRDSRALRSLAIAEEPVGELRLGAIATALTGLLPALLAPLTSRYPKVELHITPGISLDLYPRVVADTLDAALIVEPPFPLPKSCIWRPMRREPLVVLAPMADSAADPRHLLATRPFIRYDRGQWGGRLAERWLRQQGIRPQERFELDALDAIAVMVDQGLGVALVPDWAPPWPAGLRIAKLALPGKVPARSVGLLATRNASRARLLRALLEGSGLEGNGPENNEPEGNSPESCGADSALTAGNAAQVAAQPAAGACP